MFRIIELVFFQFSKDEFCPNLNDSMKLVIMIFRMAEAIKLGVLRIEIVNNNCESA